MKDSVSFRKDIAKALNANKEVVKTEIKGIKEQTQGLRQDQTTLMATQQRLKDTEEQLAEQQKIIDVDKITQRSYNHHQAEDGMTFR
jgi:hypothetical protein